VVSSSNDAIKLVKLNVMNQNTSRDAELSISTPKLQSFSAHNVLSWRQIMASALLAFAAFVALVWPAASSAQSVRVAGQLIIDVNALRGTNVVVGSSSIAGENSLIAWTNYGTLGGQFQSVLNSPFATTIALTVTNPPFVTNVTAGAVTATAVESPTGSRLMVANFNTPSQMVGNSHYTVECWFDNVGSTADPRGVFAWTITAPATGTDGGEFAGAATASDHFNANNLLWNSSAAFPPINVWHYGVITYDGTTERAYLDGVLTDSAVHALNIDNEATFPTLFSQLNAIYATTTSSSFNGAIASLRVHTEALGGADVATNYAAGLTALATAPTNTIVTDSSAPTSILGTTATLNGILNASPAPSATTLIFFYDTKDDGDATNAWPHYVVATAPGSTPGTFSANISSLTAGTTYYYKIYAVTSGATNMSSFTPSFITDGAPSIANNGAFFISPTSDNLSAKLINDGTAGLGCSVVLYYGPTDGKTNPANWANSVFLGTLNDGTIAGAVTGLTALTSNYFTFEATNAYGTNWGGTSIQFQAGVIFALNTTNLPAASLPPAALTPITTWSNSYAPFTSGAGALVHDLGGVQYADFTSANNLYVPVSAFPNGSPGTLQIAGASLVTALYPTGVNAEAGNTGGTIISTIYDEQFGIGFGGGIHVAIAGGSVIGVTITNGGSGYTVPPTVTITPPGGMSANTTATGTAQISATGVVTNVLISSGGSGYAWQRVGLTNSVPFPTVSFSAGTTTAGGTVVMGTNFNGFQIETVINATRPSDTTANGNLEDGYNWADTTYGRFRGNNVYIPSNQVSVVSVVAGSGTNSVGQPTATGANDNNYLVYVNGVLVMDTASGFVASLTLTATNGAGYLPHGGTIPLTFNTPPGGTPAAGYAVISTSTNIPGHLTTVVLTNGGTGYTAANPPIINIPGPTDTTVPQTNALITFAIQSIGNYLPSDDAGGSGLDGASSVGWNGGGMSQLVYNLGPGTYGSGNANSTFGIGDQAGTGEIGYIGYMGDLYIYGEALSPAQRQATENALAAKFITGATQTFSILTSLNGNAGSATITAPSSAVQGYSATFSVAATLGYGISSVTVNGTAVTLVNGSFTITNISATQNIVVTTVLVPQQQITVTYGTGGAVSTNGTIIPTGASFSAAGGSSQIFNFTPSPGYKVTTITVNGANVAIGSSYAFNNIGIPLTFGTNDTINVVFAALPVTAVSAYVPESQALLFGVDTISLPQTNGASVTNWPLFYSYTANTNLVQDTLNNFTLGIATTYIDSFGIAWENNIDNVGTGTTCYQLYPTSVAAGTSLPNTGATIITVVSPNAVGTTAGATGPLTWHAVVDVFFGCLEVGVDPVTGIVYSYVDNDQSTPYDGVISAASVGTSSFAIPNGSNAVISLVANPDGSYATYIDGILANTNVTLSPSGSLYLTSGHESDAFSENVTLGDDGPDSYNAFQGLIGNTYVWTTALTQTERTNLEAALISRFHIVVPPNYNWVGASGANFSSITSWSNTFPNAVTAVPTPSSVPLFSLPGAGRTVNLDQPETLAGLIFATNAIISSAAENTLSLNNGTIASVVTLRSNASPAIDVPLTSSAGVNVTGTGSLTITNGLTLGSTATSMLRLAVATNDNVTFTQAGGTIVPFIDAQNWTTAGVGPGVMLGGFVNGPFNVTYNLNGGTLQTPSIGCVTDAAGKIVAPSTYGATAILNLNGGTIQATESDTYAAGLSTDDAIADTEGSAHLIFNTTHTYIGSNGVTINPEGYTTSIAVPLEHSPTGPDIDGGFTLTGSGYLTNLFFATYTGLTKVTGNSVLVSTLPNSIGGNLLDVDDGSTIQLNFTGTQYVYQLTENSGSPLPAGTYGASGSGATHIDSHFAGTGTVTVLGNLTTPQKPNFTGSGFTGSISAGTGSIVLSGTGGVPGGAYVVVGSTNVATPVSNWVTIATGTFTAAGFSNSIPITTNLPEEFIKIVVP
jgi:Concanavalin A-like lectin/glucanases superfamily